MKYVLLSPDGAVAEYTLSAGEGYPRAAQATEIRAALRGEPIEVPCTGCSAFINGQAAEQGLQPNSLALAVIAAFGGQIGGAVVFGPVLLIGARRERLVSLGDDQITRVRNHLNGLANINQWGL